MPKEPEAHAYTDGASTGSRGPGGYGAVLTWRGKTQEVSGGEHDTTNQRISHRNQPVANRDLWERLLEATERHQEVRWRNNSGF